ncbi:MAG: integrase arm-type DNA-binding domain-containing protein, partial [Zoogloeaceae bacterium]|nr:integrase arm-type DNA-binding domain-containing protein [Zoogloeaceae bacterium]
MGEKLEITNDLSIRGLKPKVKPYRVPCVTGQGLCLEVAPSGGKLWRLRYYFEGKEKLLALGGYPAVGLAEARTRRDDARKLLANGIDPGDVKKAQKAAKAERAANSFEVIAREWLARYAPKVTARHIETVRGRMERDLFPWIGGTPIEDVTAPMLLEALRRVEGRGAVHTAKRLRMYAGQVFRYGIATGRCERDVAADLRDALTEEREQHRAAITEPKQAGELLRAIEGYAGSWIGRGALRLAPLVFVRPGELRHAEWSEIDLDKAEWNIPAGKMKMRVAHLVPLSRQAVAILRELHPMTGQGRYVFPSERGGDRPISDNTLNAALRRMGYNTREEMTAHGFRAMARTMLDEVLGFRPDFIEHQLAHAVRDPNGRAYNRTAHLAERVKMMQAWADYL